MLAEAGTGLCYVLVPESGHWAICICHTDNWSVSWQLTAPPPHNQFKHNQPEEGINETEWVLYPGRLCRRLWTVDCVKIESVNHRDNVISVCRPLPARAWCPAPPRDGAAPALGLSDQVIQGGILQVTCRYIRSLVSRLIQTLMR